jgi:hypothetical protein
LHAFNVIEGNFIGTDPSGTKDMGNAAAGVRLEFSTGAEVNNLVGGYIPADRNLISGNDSGGVSIYNSDRNYVSGNLIGTQRDGKSPLGNGGPGVSIEANDPINASGNEIGGSPSKGSNTIAFNGGSGVCVSSANGHEAVSDYIVSNSIFSNGALGIDLARNGKTTNDVGDADTGPNDLQNFPILSSASRSAAGKTTIKGKLNSVANKSYTIRFFSNPQGTNEGKKFLGSKEVTTDGTGNVSFAFSTRKKVKLGQNMTATATSYTLDTSEFSAPRKVVAS